MTLRRSVSRPWLIEDRIVIGGEWLPWARLASSSYASYEAAQRVVTAYLRRNSGAAGPTQEIRIRHREDHSYVVA